MDLLLASSTLGEDFLSSAREGCLQAHPLTHTGNHFPRQPVIHTWKPLPLSIARHHLATAVSPSVSVLLILLFLFANLWPYPECSIVAMRAGRLQRASQSAQHLYNLHTHPSHPVISELWSLPYISVPTPIQNAACQRVCGTRTRSSCMRNLFVCTGSLLQHIRSLVEVWDL